MSKRLLPIVFCGLLAVPVFAAKGPEVDMVDNKLSIDADALPLARLLRLVDQATGMKSKVPPELANRTISVKFSGLNVADGLRKIFQGQPLDYVVIQGQGVIITGASQNLTGTESVAAYPATPGQPEAPFQDFQQNPGQPGFPGQPNFPGQAGIPGQPQVQPSTIPSPFGPIANPRAGQPVQPVQPAQPATVQNSLFPASQSQNTPLQPVNNQPNAFGSLTPFGSTPQPQSNPNTLFGGSSLFQNH
ncbi:MAG TPA: hypothetical protein VGK48_10085 [Terriglobia bacterium]